MQIVIQFCACIDYAVISLSCVYRPNTCGWQQMQIVIQFCACIDHSVIVSPYGPISICRNDTQDTRNF